MTVVLAVAAVLVVLTPVRPPVRTLAERPRRVGLDRRVVAVPLVLLAGVVAPITSALGVVGVAVAVVALRRRRARQRDEALRDTVPEIADLLGVVVGAGGSVADALDVVAHRGPVAARSPLTAMLDDADRGRGLVAALQRAPLPEAHQPLLAGLVSAERDGAPLGVVVPRLAEAARTARSLRVRARVQRLPVLLLAPLTLCCLPAVLIGAVLPMAVAHLSALPF